MSHADETASDCGDPPMFCTWHGCEKKSVQIRVEVNHNGRVYRNIASDVMDHNHKLAGAYQWVGWIGRCDHHYDQEQEAISPDWREQVLREFWALHPEFKIIPSDEAERKDILIMHKAFNRKSSDAALHARQALVEAKRILARQEHERERELLTVDDMIGLELKAAIDA